MSPTGPNLSHWPGNRTPERWKADLSTGICLAFAKSSEADRAAFLSGATVVLNDHYDTDGFLSLLCILRPDIALAREAVLLEAAATGDFQAFHGRRGFAVDRIVLNLAAESSPLASEFAGLSGSARDFARYRWLIDHAADVLDHPDELSVLYEAELAAVEAGLADPAIIHKNDPTGSCLACFRSPAPVHRMVLNTLAGRCFRVLHCMTQADLHSDLHSDPHGAPAAPDRGPTTLYRFHDRTESWFEVKSFTPPARVDLEVLRAGMAAAEDERGGAVGEWCLDCLEQPVPELYHGIPGDQEYGRVTRQLTASCLPPETVETAFAGFFARHG